MKKGALDQICPLYVFGHANLVIFRLIFFMWAPLIVWDSKPNQKVCPPVGPFGLFVISKPYFPIFWGVNASPPPQNLMSKSDIYLVKQAERALFGEAERYRYSGRRPLCPWESQIPKVAFKKVDKRVEICYVLPKFPFVNKKNYS